ncbi:hypothetical protein QOT17_015259 [Balamuthia mandrillaris]
MKALFVLALFGLLTFAHADSCSFALRAYSDDACTTSAAREFPCIGATVEEDTCSTIDNSHFAVNCAEEELAFYSDDDCQTASTVYHAGDCTELTIGGTWFSPYFEEECGAAASLSPFWMF